MAINRNKVLAKAQKQLRKRNWSRALREYQKLVDDDAADMRSRLKCADLFTKLDRPDDALQSYKSVADHYAQQEMYEKAIAVYKQAKRIDPDDIALRHAIGECYYRLGRLKDAIRTFHEVQNAYGEQGSHDLQRQVLEHMVRIDPDDVGLRIQLAERYTKDDLREPALESFHYCAEILEDEGRLDELVQVLERIIFLNPDRHDLRKRVVRIYLDRRDNQEALKHLQICFRELPKDLETLELLAQTFERLDRTDKAIMVLEELVPLYEDLDRQSDLTNLYRRLLRLDPEHPEAQQALGQSPSSGPDSSVLSRSRTDTGAHEQRQHTPADGVEALDDVEFLDDDIEFLDDDLDAELVPEQASSSPAPGPPPSTPSAPPPPVADAPPVDMTEELEFVDQDDGDDILDIDDLDGVQEIDGVDEISEVQEIEPIEAVEPVDDVDPIRDLLSECDVFIRYGLYDKASSLIEEALQRDPTSLYAQNKRLALHEATGNIDLQVQTLFDLAELESHSPSVAYDYLKRAEQLVADPLGVQIKAKALGIDLDDGPPDEGVTDIDVGAIEVVDDTPGPPETLHMDVNDLNDDDPSPEVDDDEELDLVGDALDDLGDALDSFGESSPPPAEDDGLQAIDEDLDEDLFDGLGDDTDPDITTLGDASSEVVDDDDLTFGDADDIVDMDLDADDGFDDRDLQSLDEDTDPSLDPDQNPSVNDLFDEVETDDLFDDLFGGSGSDPNPFDTDSHSDGAINLGADDTKGEMAEIDFFIQQGLAEEAAEALERFQADNPNHPGIAKRQNQLQQIRSGLPAEENPFGAQSLSQKFNPQAVEDPTTESGAVDLQSVANSNLELGIAYRDMGLVEEAIDEFQQATDDPEAALQASFHIGLCQVELGRHQDAEQTFQTLLNEPDLDPSIEDTVRQKLNELEVQTS